MRRRVQYRNEVKTRLPDRVYSGLQAFKRLQGIESDSAALCRLAELQLFGTVGNLPVNLMDVSAEVGRGGMVLA
ncbi:hypothetical protein [Paraburkholderia caribensis]|uniref:hypothetical protein n=1 Tax=Paraburkholderia caribensis TaxID=75105 RepID=UPI001CAD264A|nr:hypothetical protein [Paraburkholderia caribensis]CAG9256169.1 conserved hypothetical protein [Paraburkholderia caribensis]